MSEFPLHAKITLLSGYTYELSDGDILSFSLSDGVSGGDMLLGSAISSYYTLTLFSPDGAWQRGGALLGERTLRGATVELENSENGEKIGCFIISGAESSEGGDSILLSGYDPLLHRFAGVFTDTLTYPCTLSEILASIASKAGCTVTGTPLCNADILITARPSWGEGCTLRRALAYTAGAMGCFARWSREGKLTLTPLKQSVSRAFQAENAYELKLGDTPFVFNRLRVFPRGAKEGAYTEAILDPTLPYGADNTLTIDDNPLFRSGSSELRSLTNNLCRGLSGLSFTPFSMTAESDISLETGTFATLTDLTGNTHTLWILSRQLTVDPAVSLHISCDMENGGVSLPRIITSSGKITSAALTDGIISARHIAAGAVDAEKITARSITADHIQLGAITSESGVIGDLSADSVTSGKLNTDRLIVGGTEFSIVRALNQLADSLSENDDSIDGGVLSDKSISASKVTDDFGTGLELSSNAAVLMLAGKLDGSNSHMELTQDAINMVGGEINIATNDLEIRGVEDGDEIMSLDPEGLSARRVAVTEHFSAPNVVLSHHSATAEWKGGIQKSLNALPKYLARHTLLTVPAGTYEEDITISGFLGAKLSIYLEEGVRICGTLSISCCDYVSISTEALGNAAIYASTANSYTVQIEACRYVNLKSLQLSGFRGRSASVVGTATVVHCTASNVMMRECCVEYASTQAIYTNATTFTCLNCIGGSGSTSASSNANLQYGVVAVYGSHGVIFGSSPMSANGNNGNTSATLITYNAPSKAGGMTYVAPAQVTRSFAISKHCTYLYGESRKQDTSTTEFYQGRYGEYTSGMNNWRIGAMWFASAAAELANKTIVSAKLTLRRSSGGWSNAVNVYLGKVALKENAFNSTYSPTFTPSSTYPKGSLKREAEASFDVTDLMSSIQAGEAIGVYEPRSNYGPDNWSNAYTRFYGKGSSYEPVLTVTYK
ncbi:MAG: hypothetical protein IKW00_08870 [Clostridia bacterium]|nr:hypothetical protein [Clostridia bacterium]